MAKAKTNFVCQSCGAILVRWSGRCPECSEWNSIVEERVIESGNHVRPSFKDGATATPITDNSQPTPVRQKTALTELDRVLGGGIVPGSLVLIGGDPGIGKSTLMLQISHHIADLAGPVLYVSGEESFDQTRMRAGRLGTLSNRLMIYTETSLEQIRAEMGRQDYVLAVVDSIQSIYSPDLPAVPGSVGQIRDCANELLRLAKGRGIPIFLVGHVTKDGSIAGPRLLEHLVDTVLYFEGEGKQALRILRAVKNRFGSTNEIGAVEMTESGLREVPNPSALFLSERPKGVSGSVVIPSVEGTRPLLVEVQALVGDTPLASPRRTVAGINPNRVALILAVLEKRAGAHIADKDVFVNVAGGVKLDEPAADIAVAVALMSSLLEAPVASDLAVFGEVGLAGEVRAVDMVRARVAEASKFGFSRCILPRSCAADVREGNIEVVPVNTVSQAIDIALDRI